VSPEAAAATSIRLAEPSDAAAIAAIYNHYVRETAVTFEDSSGSCRTGGSTR
jgi:L-amino acid N-acyltransferase YncA